MKTRTKGHIHYFQIYLYHWEWSKLLPIFMPEKYVTSSTWPTINPFNQPKLSNTPEVWLHRELCTRCTYCHFRRQNTKPYEEATTRKRGCGWSLEKFLSDPPSLYKLPQMMAALHCVVPRVGHLRTCSVCPKGHLPSIADP